ncbi:hypothetical protein, partial [Streptococcus pneumoniae]|uniref:hypothetical protein n=1 Tax=Streptococcus pneumoniae TaxID=1313 RepID=UPI000AC30F0C
AIYSGGATIYSAYAIKKAISAFFHVYIIGSEMNFVKIVLSILGIIFVCILTIARIYRTFFYKE